MARHRSSSRKKDDFSAPRQPSADPFQPRPFAPVPEAQTSEAQPTGPIAGPAFHTFSIQDPSGTSRQPIQPKLTIGAPGDKYEQEADRVASQVVQQIQAPQSNAPLQRDALEANTLQRSPMLQRLEMPEEDELQRSPTLQRDTLEEDELKMRPTTEAGAGGPASESLESAISQARGSGQGLDPNLQQQMGQAMGADFSGITIHTDTQSDQLNRSIQAKAFTTGQDIFFRQGAYQPSSQSGQELIAHELTHVVQQNHEVVQRNLDEIVQRVTIEEIDEDESINDWQPPQEIRQPSTPLMLTDRPWSEIEAQQNQKDTNHDGVTIEEIDEDESLSSWQPPQEIRQPSTPLMLTDRPWSEIEKEQSQLNDPRYQKKLNEISPKAPQSVNKLNSKNPALEEHFSSHTLENFQQIDPRYQEKLKEISPKAPTTRGALEPASIPVQGHIHKQAEIQLAWKEMLIMQTKAKQKIQLLDTDDKNELQKIDKERTIKAPKKTTAHFKERTEQLKQSLQWAINRLSRRSLISHLEKDIENTKVVGRFSQAFAAQARDVYTKKVIKSDLLTTSRSGSLKIQTDYRQTLKNLADQHKKVHDLDQKGAKYGVNNLQDLMIAVDAVISRPDFSLDDHSSDLSSAIDAFNQALLDVTTRSQERMERARKAEDKLSSHSKNGQDPRGKKEEQEALKKINTLFTETQSKIRQENRAITDNESHNLADATDVLDSYQNRDKERQAHDLKATYEAAPYFLDDKISKIVHEERHKVEGKKTYKTINQLEEDYKKEVDAQYKASKEIWCTYLGYINGNGESRVTNNVGQHNGDKGHHTVFIGPYTTIVNARDKNASEPDSKDREVDELMDIFYPSNGTSGAHYTLETGHTSKPHAYRGGEVRPGAKYQADKYADNDRWKQVETYMQQQQALEETRVRNKIQHALDDHMKVVHHKDPNKRTPK